MKKSFLLAASLLCFILIISSCKKDDETKPNKHSKHIKYIYYDQVDYGYSTRFYYDNEWNLIKVYDSSTNTTSTTILTREHNVLKFHETYISTNGTRYYEYEYHYYQDSIRVFHADHYKRKFILNSNGEIVQEFHFQGEGIVRQTDYNWVDGNIQSYTIYNWVDGNVQSTGTESYRYDLNVLNPYPFVPVLQIVPSGGESEFYSRNFFTGFTHDGEYHESFNVVTSDEEGYPLYVISLPRGTIEYTYYE
jgi:hypothetical protein